MTDRQIFDSAVAFTETYRKHLGSHKAVREAMCCRQLYPACLSPIREGDLFAGANPDHAFNALAVDFGIQKGSGQSGYIMSPKTLAELKARLGPESHAQIDGMIELWRAESTFVKYWRHAAASDPEMGEYLRFELDEAGYDANFKHYLAQPKGIGRVITCGNSRLAGLMLDFDKLLRLGLPGLAEQIAARRRDVEKKGGDAGFLEGLLISIETLKDICAHYQVQAEALARNAGGSPAGDELREMARVLDKLQKGKPETLREAIQLMWISTLASRVLNYARMDVYLGDFYARDIDSGTLTEDEAMRLVMALWHAIEERKIVFDSRVVIGGKGRRNEANADRFALAAMEATRRLRGLTPVLSLRFHEGQAPALLRKALDVIGEGCLYPTLYNDDVYVPGTCRIMDVPESEAEKYLPLGCGELILDSASSGSPNSALNVPKALEAALHDGIEPLTGERLGPRTGSPETFDTFAKLLDAVKAQLRHAMETDVRAHLHQHQNLSRECSFLFQSLLLDDCVERGKDMVSGGLRHLGACIEGFGFTNAGDSLHAIKTLVYERRRLTLGRLTQALDADFAGFEAERQMMLAVPKYGNNHPDVDAMVADISTFIHETAKAIGTKAGLAYYIVSSVNPGGITLGRFCGATADGRRCGEPFAVGDSPTAGFDRNGLTSMLLSVAKSDAANGGYITNLKLSREMFAEGSRPKTEALLNVFFKRGGMQLNITVLGRKDLENAIRDPAKHAHVMVRIGGYSAKFVDLDAVMQQEIMARTFY
jgi:pyruvate-formate lyase